MKRAIATIVTMIMALICTPIMAAHVAPIKGTVIDEQGDPVGYATVVISLDDTQIAGAATDDKGEFSVVTKEGTFDLFISYIGYETYSCEVASGEDLGEITLVSDATEIEDVVVTSNFIRREADRFVVDVANAPAAIGQDGEELLKSSPGVWINEDEISINGNSNPKVFVNDRELKMTSEEIMLYLRNLKSDEVRSIEIIPLSGADFDASSASGVIMIYLRRQLNAGMIGRVGLRSGYNENLFNISPSAGINFQSEKLTLNTSGWYNNFNHEGSGTNNAKYMQSNATLNEESHDENESSSRGGRIEAVYNLNDRHSIGGEFRYFRRNNAAFTSSVSSMLFGSVEQLSSSTFDSRGGGENISSTINYIYKLDTIGSTIKLLADYNKNLSNSFSDNNIMANQVDSLHQNISSSDFAVSTVTLALEKVVSPKLTIKSGLKYTRNDMDSHSKYKYLDAAQQWVDLTDYNSDELYTEDIAAAYFIGRSKIGNWSFVAGLRGEYTQTKGRDNLLNKDYVSLFPNLNVSYLLDPMGSNSITMQYSRSINRPSFWSLNPARKQNSEYTYNIGNPSLMPEYKNSINLTYVYKYKYSISASMQIAENSVVQIMTQDEIDPNVIRISHENIDAQSSYFLSANLPFQITKWWNLNTNLTYGYRGEKLSNEAETEYQHMFFANAQSSFTLPKEFYLNLNFYGMSGMNSGNIHVAARNFTSVSLNKKMFDKRITASVMCSNIFSQPMTVISSTANVEQKIVSNNAWSSPRFGVSLSYNFKAGKEYRARQGVESASAEDQARMSGGGGEESN